MSATPRRVYVDSCVLMLAASAQEEEVAQRAFEELNKPEVRYLFSSFVEMEVIPRPTHNKRQDEVEFYKTYFESAERINCSEEEQQLALKMMCECNGLLSVDAVHLSCAASSKAHEFVTSEGPTKPMVERPPLDGFETIVRTIRGPSV